MVDLPDGETILKICLFVLTQSTNVTDRYRHTHTHTHAHTHRQTDTHKHSLSNVKEADSNCRQCEHGQRHLYVARPTEMNVIRTKPNEMTETM